MIYLYRQLKSLIGKYTRYSSNSVITTTQITYCQSCQKIVDYDSAIECKNNKCPVTPIPF